MGIRRRLAPLLQNDRRKIELLNSLLLSMPGTPVIYYGDEIGMGDNYYLGDRDGVRTPMQWSADRNAGFSRANPQQLYLPTIQDPVHGFEAVNVEAQQRSPSSLSQLDEADDRRARSATTSSGAARSSCSTRRTARSSPISRHGGDEAVLCVANLSRQAQAAEIDLSAFAGRVPIELTGQSPFPPVGELPYLLTLPAYGFYWFLLADEQEAPAWHTPHTADAARFPDADHARRHAVGARWTTGAPRNSNARRCREYLPLQRWFAAKEGRDREGASAPAGRDWTAGTCCRWSMLPWTTAEQALFPAALGRLGRGAPDHGAAPARDARQAAARQPRRRAARRRRRRGHGATPFWRRCVEGREMDAGAEGRLDVLAGTERLATIAEDPGEPRLLVGRTVQRLDRLFATS